MLYILLSFWKKDRTTNTSRILFSGCDGCPIFLDVSFFRQEQLIYFLFFGFSKYFFLSIRSYLLCVFSFVAFTKIFYEFAFFIYCKDTFMWLKTSYNKNGYIYCRHKFTRARLDMSKWVSVTVDCRPYRKIDLEDEYRIIFLERFPEK